jgi:Alginate lyase
VKSANAGVVMTAALALAPQHGVSTRVGRYRPLLSLGKDRRYLMKSAGFRRSVEALCMGLLCTIISAVGAQPCAAINWSPWSLQLPNNTTVNPGSTHDAWFYPDGSFQAFMDPKTGTTTSGSVHCRTELHENASWSSSGTNTLSATVKVTKIGSGKTTIAQVFSNNGHTLLELEYGTNGFTAFYEEAKGAGSSTSIGHAVGLGSTFTYKVAFSGKKLTVTINGGTAWTKTPSSSGSSGTFYFKAGNYDQSATSGPVSTTPYSIVEFSALSISH